MTSRHLSAKIKVTRRESTLSVNYPGHMVDQPMVDVDEIVTQNHCSATLPALPAPPVNMENALQEKLQAILVTSEGLDSRFQQLQSSMSNLEDRVTQQLTNMPDELSSQLIAAQSAKVPQEEQQNVLLQLSKSQREVSRLKQENENLMAQSNVLEKRQKQMQGEKQNLKHMMVDTKAEKDEPNVNELNPAFVEIRSHIFSVCHKLDLDSPIKTPLSYPDSIKKIYSKIAKLRNKESRKRLMRSEMYEVLQEDIFEGTCFGLTGDIERDLGKVEKQIKKAQQGDVQVLLEWRKLTIQCVRPLRKSSSRAEQDKTVHHLLDLTKPFIPATKLARDALSDDLRSLCEKAANFTLRIRQSRSLYEVVSIMPGSTLSGMESPLLTPDGSVDDTLGEEDIPGARVAYTVFGALRRFEYGQGEPVVLDKALIAFEK